MHNPSNQGDRRKRVVSLRTEYFNIDADDGIVWVNSESKQVYLKIIYRFVVHLPDNFGVDNSVSLFVKALYRFIAILPHLSTSDLDRVGSKWKILESCDAYYGWEV